MTRVVARYHRSMNNAALRCRWGMVMASAVLSAGSGCRHARAHVRLDPPAATAPLDQRAAVYRSLKTREIHRVVRGSLLMGRTITIDHLETMDGRRIFHPGDLAPVVPPDSATARAITEYQREKTQAFFWRLGGYIVAGVGAILLGQGMEQRSDDSGNGWVIAGATIALSGSLMVTLGGNMADGRAHREKGRAFKSYDMDLARGLALCHQPEVCEVGTAEPPRR